MKLNPISIAALALLAAPPFSISPMRAQDMAAKAPIADPDAANAPIADRETANIPAKQGKIAPQLAQIGIARTNYPIPTGAIFASPSGDANSSGNEREKPTTLIHALEIAPANATIVLAGGDYRGINGLKIQRAVTMQPLPGQMAWIKGSDVVSGFVPDGGRFSVAWDKKLTHPNEQDLDKNNPLAMDTDMVFLGGKSLKQVAKVEEVGPGTFCVDIALKKLVLGDDPRGKEVEATVAVTGFGIVGREVAGTTLRGLGFAHFAEHSMEAFSTKMLFENNTFAWNAVRGMNLHDPDNVMRGNTFACNGLSGMQGVFTDRLLFENNRVLFNNIEGFRATWSAAGAKFIVAKDMTFRGNTFENNQAAALWFDISCLRTDVIANTVRSNRGLGIYYELCHGGLAAFNVCEDNGVGLMLSDSSGVRVWNNTFLDNSKAIVVKDTARVNDGKGEGWLPAGRKSADLKAGATWIAAGNEFHNNLFAGGRGKGTALFEANAPAKGLSSRDMIAVLDRNAYVRSGPNAAQVLLKWNEGGKPVDFESLEGFRAANPGYEPSAALLTVSPMLGGGDYRLMAGSSLAKAGAGLPSEVAVAALLAGVKMPQNGVPIGAMGAVR